MVFCAPGRVLENFHPTQQGVVWNTFSPFLLHKSTWRVCSSLRLRTSECELVCFVTRRRWQSYHPVCFLSVQKQEVKSSEALSKEVRKQAWPWKWGTGWPDRRAGSPPTAAWTATARRGSEWGWLGRPHPASPGAGCELCLTLSAPHQPDSHSAAPLSAVNQADSLGGLLLTCHQEMWQIWRFISQEVCLGNKMFCFSGKIRNGDFPKTCKWKRALIWKNT